MTTSAPHTILAFDPGTATVGWAVLLQEGSRARLGGCGALRTSKTEKPQARLMNIHTDVRALIAEWRPDVMVLERQFFAKNQTTATTVGQAVGVIMLAAAEEGLDVFEIPPQVKLAVVGEGTRTKQVQYMSAVHNLNRPEARRRRRRSGHRHLPPLTKAAAEWTPPTLGGQSNT